MKLFGKALAWLVTQAVKHPDVAKKVLSVVVARATKK
jgi:hypothetical protein